MLGVGFALALRLLFVLASSRRSARKSVSLLALSTASLPLLLLSSTTFPLASTLKVTVRLRLNPLLSSLARKAVSSLPHTFSPLMKTDKFQAYFTCKEIHDLVQNREEHAVVIREFSPEELAKINAGEEKKRKEKMLKFKKHKKAMKEMSQINELQAVKRSPSPEKVRPGRKGYLSSEFVAPEDM